MKKAEIIYLAKTRKNKILTKDNVLIINRKLREASPDLYEINSIFGILEFVSFDPGEYSFDLRQAVVRGDIEIVKYLFEAGAGSEGNNLLQIAVYRSQLEIVKYLIESGEDIYASKSLFWSAWHGNLEIVKFLVNLGVDVNSDPLALCFAASKGHFEVVKYLVTAGANIHTKNDLAFRYAERYGHTEILEYLASQS